MIEFIVYIGGSIVLMLLLIVYLNNIINKWDIKNKNTTKITINYLLNNSNVEKN